jgi:hypothetical protein
VNGTAVAGEAAPLRIGSVMMGVREMAQSLAFYRDALGLAVLVAAVARPLVVGALLAPARLRACASSRTATMACCPPSPPPRKAASHWPSAR